MKIKTIIIYKEDFLPEGISSQNVTTRKYIHSLTEYDERGNVIREENYLPDGTVEDKIVNTYDENGNLIAYVNTINGEVAENKSWEYENGKVSKEYIHYVDGSKDVVNYEYDNEGRLTSKKYYDDEGEMEQQTDVEYDGETVKEITHDDEGEISEEHQSVYKGDKSLSRSQKDYTTGEGVTVKNEYDDKGRVISTMRYNENDEMIEKVTREYNENDRVSHLIQESQLKNSDVYFEYDQAGNPIKQEEILDDGTQLALIERKYDENNLHKQSSVFINGMGERMSQNYNVYHEYEFYD